MSWAKELIDNPETRQRLFPGVTSQSLLELGALYFAFFYDHTRSPSQEIVKRLWSKHCSVTNANISGELQPEDIIQVLGCSRAKAKQYVSLLRVIMI
jgi:hypothetical protein